MARRIGTVVPGVEVEVRHGGQPYLPVPDLGRVAADGAKRRGIAGGEGTAAADRPGRAARDAARTRSGLTRGRTPPPGRHPPRLVRRPRPAVPPAAALRRPARAVAPRATSCGRRRGPSSRPGCGSTTSASRRRSGGASSGRSPASSDETGPDQGDLVRSALHRATAPRGPGGRRVGPAQAVRARR